VNLAGSQFLLRMFCTTCDAGLHLRESVDDAGRYFYDGRRARVAARLRTRQLITIGWSLYPWATLTTAGRIIAAELHRSRHHAAT
jgi:hypothetical protein